jgi:hypothetical protein
LIPNISTIGVCTGIAIAFPIVQREFRSLAVFQIELIYGPVLG